MQAKYSEAIEGNLKGSATGAATGATIGSVLPGYGTAIGAVVGGAIGGTIGGVSGFMSGSKKDSAQRKKREAWEKAQRLLLEARVRADNQRRALIQQSFSPVNSALVGMYGPSANAMGDGTSYMPQATPPKGGK